MASPCRHLLVPVLVTRGSWPCRRCLLCGWSGEHHRAALLALREDIRAMAALERESATGVDAGEGLWTSP